MALNREKVTLENAKSWIKNNSPSDVPLLDQIKQERELFNFLKDGKVLLRILGYNAQKEGKDPENSIEDKMIIRYLFISASMHFQSQKKLYNHKCPSSC